MVGVEELKADSSLGSRPSASTGLIVNWSGDLRLGLMKLYQVIVWKEDDK